MMENEKNKEQIRRAEEAFAKFSVERLAEALRKEKNHPKDDNFGDGAGI